MSRSTPMPGLGVWGVWQRCLPLFMCGVIVYEKNGIRDRDARNCLIHSDFSMCFLIECHEMISDG